MTGDATPATGAVELLRRMWAHLTWADALVRAALGQLPMPEADEAWREYSHILGAEEVWLARIEGRASRTAVWPVLTRSDADALHPSVMAGYERLLVTLDDAALGRIICYTNSAGQGFETALGDILTHALLHGQYHRGKVNLLLRHGGANPAPVDFIAFARGAPAAVTPR